MKTIEKIKQYYKEDRLEVLDKGKTYGEWSTYHYSAVSLDYIHKYVLKEKVSKQFVARKIFELCKQKVLRPIPCDHAGDLVFIRYNFYRNGFVQFFVKKNNKKIGLPLWYKTSKYSRWVNNFNQYLK